MRSCSECGLRYPAGEFFCAADGSKIVESDDAFLGETVGKYRVVRLLGAGGMGRVYLARNPHIGSRVAVKVLTSAAASDKEMVQRFFREAQLVNKIRHEGIVNVFDFDELPDGRPYIVMECLDGEPLSWAIGKRPMGLERAGAIAVDILDALQAAHDAGVVHRDLKPDNVFLTPQGRVKLLDFGIAKLMPSFDAAAALSTKSGVVMGTPGYMAPEQVLGQAVAPTTDIYAMGSILYESLTGQLAFRGTSIYELFSRIVREPPRPPAEIRAELAGPYQDLILRAMAKDPGERFASARDMSAAIEALFRSATPFAAQSLPAKVAHDGADGLGALETAYASQAPHLAEERIYGNTTRVSRRRTYLGFALAALAAGGLAAAIFNHETGRSPAVAVGGPSAPDASIAVADAQLAALPVLVEHSADPGQGPGERPRQPRPRNPVKQSPSKNTSDPISANSGVTLIETGAKHKDRQIHRSPDFDPKSFDAAAYLPRARALAKQIYPDAYLVTFDIEGVAPSGKANLARFRLEATYHFLSPAHSKRSTPVGVEEDLPCWVYVEVDHQGVTARIVEQDSCKGKARPNPRCSLTKVWERAIALGAPATGAVAGIDYLWDGWFVTIDPLNFTESIPDDC